MQKRNFNIELFRIITMLLIVASHYVVNSGLVDEINSASLGVKSIFLVIFGAWGSAGINCFVLITGYFMCKSQITKEKFLKIFLEYEFYKVIFYIIFIVAGYEEFSLNAALKAINPFHAADSFLTDRSQTTHVIVPAVRQRKHHRQQSLGFERQVLVLQMII